MESILIPARVEELERYIENLSAVTAEKERIGAELSVATHIQASMLPRIFPAFPERREFEVYATMDPAKEVGGDFYNFFPVDDDHLAVVMADVFGKGGPGGPLHGHRQDPDQGPRPGGHGAAETAGCRTGCPFCICEENLTGPLTLKESLFSFPMVMVYLRIRGGGGMKKILLVEDDAALGQGICLALNSEGTAVTHCGDLLQGRRALTALDYDLLILDINLTDGSGLELLREVRQTSSLPIILLTADDLETDIVVGLESGADDYITKPFSLAVLRARVNAQLRRTAPAQSEVVEVGGFVFDFQRMEFRKDGRLIDLSKTEQKLLRLLVENRGVTLPRETLLDRVWTDGVEYVEENALSVTVKRLRDKLEDTPSRPRYLKTVYGVGYTWVVK